MRRKAAFFLMRDLRQDVPHKMDLATLPGSSQELLFRRRLDAAGMGVRNAQPHSPEATFFQLLEKRPPRVLRLVEHGLHSQDLPGSLTFNAMGDHQRQRNEPVFDPNFVVIGVDHNERIFLFQRPRPERFYLIPQPLIDLRDLGGRDIFNP